MMTPADPSRKTPDIGPRVTGDVRAPSQPEIHAEPPLFSRRWRALGYFLLVAVLGVGFAAYQHPTMILQWETLMALCGLG